MGLELSKKFESKLTVVECIYKVPPKFYFFETSSDKRKSQKRTEMVKKELEKWKELAKEQGVKIKTKFAITESIAEWVIDYIFDNKIDLVIVDYPKLSKVEATIYDDIIHIIHEKSKCAVLTAKY